MPNFGFPERSAHKIGSLFYGLRQSRQGRRAESLLVKLCWVHPERYSDLWPADSGFFVRFSRACFLWTVPIVPISRQQRRPEYLSRAGFADSSVVALPHTDWTVSFLFFWGVRIVRILIALSPRFSPIPARVFLWTVRIVRISKVGEVATFLDTPHATSFLRLRENLL